MKTKEGYIKFNLNWEEKEFNFDDQVFNGLNFFRQKLFELGLIGAYPDGIGFGNISIRYNTNEFIISGSATGNIHNLSKNHYSLVHKVDLQKNSLHCTGLSKASSESLSHASIYESNENANAVLHVHNEKMWSKYLDYLPTTNKKAEFGTPEMAFELQSLSSGNKGILIMGGHPEGIITYGESLDSAFDILLEYYKNL